MLYPLLSLMALCLTMSIPSCKAQPQPPLSGHMETNDEWKPFVYLVKPRHFNEIAADYLGLVIDSAAIGADGSFSFQNLTVPDTKMLFILAVQKKGTRFANHLDDIVPSEANYMPIVLSKESAITCKAQIVKFQQSFSIAQPSYDHQVLMSLRDVRSEAHRRWTENTAGLPEDDSLIIVKEELYEQYIDVLRQFADSTNSFEAALVAIRWASPNGDYERMPEFLHGQCEKWKKIQPGHDFVNELCTAADKKNLPVMVGDMMPDYTLPLATGDTVSLSSLIGQRLTVVNVWASWCAPCRKENREILAPLWAAYKDKGLQIIAYSIDSHDTAWKSAITKDGATWVHASHLTGDASPFMETLRISTIPANFILDGKGEIIAKNLHGEALENFIMEYLK
jgi:peroxiredoxin